MRNDHMRQILSQALALADAAVDACRTSPAKDPALRFAEAEKQIAEVETLFGQEADTAYFSLSMHDRMAVIGEGTPKTIFQTSATIGSTLLFNEYSQFMNSLRPYHAALADWLEKEGDPTGAQRIRSRAMRTTVSLAHRTDNTPDLGESA